MFDSYPLDRPAPEITAASLIDKFPGSNLASKSSSVLIASSVAGYLISKEIYLLDAHFLEALCIFGAYYVWYSNMKGVANDYFDGKRATIKNVLNQARADHKAVVQERIDHVAKMSDVVKVTEAMYDISKDIAKLEAEAFELKQKVDFKHEVKSTLDSWIRQETSIRESQQKKLVAQVIENVKAKLADPKTQQAILAQTITDIEKITLTKK
ncbi:hypothetical protein BC833DRAFT_614290 [Globomyces pollinis-pini]|nr:hypothetical protein BC833DRAFT_614290 [Globomyces pollinis-pini]